MPARVGRTVVQSYVVSKLRPSSKRWLVNGGILSTAGESIVERFDGGHGITLLNTSKQPVD